MAGLARRASSGALALGLALLMAWVLPPGAAAFEFGADAIAEWCEVDPPFVVRTPGNRVVVLHATNYALGKEHWAAVARARVSAEARPIGGEPAPVRPVGAALLGAASRAEAVLVNVVVEIPLGTGGQRFRTRSVVSTRPKASGTILATAEGVSGDALRMQFRLEVS
jgi:hypothetical protein